jgi:hypothetical protein
VLSRIEATIGELMPQSAGAEPNSPKLV